MSFKTKQDAVAAYDAASREATRRLGPQRESRSFTASWSRRVTDFFG